MSAKKTAWHPPFTDLLTQRRPAWARVTGEVQLSAEPLRVDDVIEVWAQSAHDPSDVGGTLRQMWRYIVVVGLLEYKSVVWPFHHGDLYRLIAYGMLWLAARQQRERQPDGSRNERLAAHEVTLILAVPALNAALRDELEELSLALPASDTGYFLVPGLPVPLLVIDLGVVAAREDDDLLGWFAGIPPHTLAAKRWVRQHLPGEGTDMTTTVTPDLEGYEEFVAETMAMFTPEQRLAGLPLEQRLAGLAPEQRLVGLAPEQRLAGLAPEQRLAGLAPEQRLAGLSVAEAILALPDEALRGLAEDFVATLPADVQTVVRARRGH